MLPDDVAGGVAAGAGVPAGGAGAAGEAQATGVAGAGDGAEAAVVAGAGVTVVAGGVVTGRVVGRVGREGDLTGFLRRGFTAGATATAWPTFVLRS